MLQEVRHADSASKSVSDGRLLTESFKSVTSGASDLVSEECYSFCAVTFPSLQRPRGCMVRSDFVIRLLSSY